MLNGAHTCVHTLLYMCVTPIDKGGNLIRFKEYTEEKLRKALQAIVTGVSEIHLEGQLN